MTEREEQLSESICGALSTKIYDGIRLLAVAVAIAVVVGLLVAVVVAIVAATDVAAALGQLEIISGRQ